MKDVLGLSFRGAVAQIPDSEANDMIWPYNQKEVYSGNNENW